MSFRRNVAIVCALLTWLLGSCPAHPQTPPATATPALGLKEPVQPDTLTEYRAGIEERLTALGPAPAENDAHAEERTLLQQLLQVLSALEKTWAQQAAYRQQIADLPTSLRAAEAESRQLGRGHTPLAANVTEELRDNYEVQLKASRQEIQDRLQQVVAGEVRLASIAKEIEQHALARLQLEENLSAIPKDPAEPVAPLTSLRESLLRLQIQLHEAEETALELEREWLLQRVPLQDQLLSNSQKRFRSLEQTLTTIKQQLGQSIEAEQESLRNVIDSLAQHMKEDLDPTEARVLQVSLDTAQLRHQTTIYRQRRNGIRDQIQAIEQKQTRLQEQVDRLSALVEKYATGEVIAERIPVIFARIRRERIEDEKTPDAPWDQQLRNFNTRLFELEDQLYEFDTDARQRVASLATRLAAAAPEQRAAATQKLEALLTEQKQALREQQQVLSFLVHDINRLLTLQREYQRQLDASYFATLSKIFWLQDSPSVNLDTLQSMLRGAWTTGRRLSTFAQQTYQQGRTVTSEQLTRGLPVLLLFLLLGWLAHKIRAALRPRVDLLLARAEAEQRPPGLIVSALVLLRSLVWPTYILLVVWLYEAIMRPQLTDSAVSVAAIGGAKRAAVVVWVYFLGRQVFRLEGWGQHLWGFGRALCSTLRRAVTFATGAALVCLVPRHILLAIPGPGDTATDSLALARFLYLLFQGAILLLIARLAQPSAPLMQFVLQEPTPRHTPRIWPFVYALLLLSLATIMILDILGYRYAAGFLWWRVLPSLAILVVLWIAIRLPLPTRLLHVPARRLSSSGGTAEETKDLEELQQRYVHLAAVLRNSIFVLIALGAFSLVWDISLPTLLTSPTVSHVLTVIVVVAVTIALTLVILRVSRVLTNYLLEPRTTAEGETIEVSRKLKTLAPLVQTVIRVGAVFVAVLIILEQIGVATGPLLAGVGIFGLAVGFASQSLIKDVINGLFILFEDSFAVGDVIEVNGVAGVVERFTLRAVTLRDLSANVYIIPNSLIDRVKNFTKEYSRYLLEVGVAYREDVDTVIEILREITQEMREDPLFRSDLLEPLEVMGLDRFEDSAVIIRARLTTRPGEQWRVARAFNQRMKKVFDERGIEIPFPHRTIYWGAPKEGAPPPVVVHMENDRAPHHVVDPKNEKLPRAENKSMS
ncbi:MAG: mechanosensitive ion channel domain-containing protein [Candidatus Binatia bacterium]